MKAAQRGVAEYLHPPPRRWPRALRGVDDEVPWAVLMRLVIVANCLLWQYRARLVRVLLGQEEHAWFQ
jgi:hypothetical protein